MYEQCVKNENGNSLYPFWNDLPVSTREAILEFFGDNGNMEGVAYV